MSRILLAQASRHVWSRLTFDVRQKIMRKIFASIACFFTGWFSNSSNASQSAGGNSESDWASRLVWLEPGSSDSPFPNRVLDCRSVALGFTATTSDPAIATKFVESRKDDGRGLIGCLPPNTFTVKCDLRFPYDGKRDEGVIYAAREMEDKWDFFVYSSRLYIRRSWTGQLVHVAEISYTDSEVVISCVHSSHEIVHGDPEYAKAHIKFLIVTHLGNQMLPFPIPPGTDQNDKRAIALGGFSSYGSRAQFAHFL
jgi:hypothetical protein